MNDLKNYGSGENIVLPLNRTNLECLAYKILYKFCELFCSTNKIVCTPTYFYVQLEGLEK